LLEGRGVGKEWELSILSEGRRRKKCEAFGRSAQLFARGLPKSARAEVRSSSDGDRVKSIHTHIAEVRLVIRV